MPVLSPHLRSRYTALKSLSLEIANSHLEAAEGFRSHRRLSVSILEEGGRLGLKCLLLSYFRVGDNPGVSGDLVIQ